MKKKIIIVITLIVYCICAKTQIDTNMIYNDTLIIITTFEYDLNFGVNDNHRTCLSQKTFTFNNQLRRDIIFDPKNGKISQFIYYFHDDNKNILSEEVYHSNGNINYIVEHKYASNLLTNKTIYLVSNNSLKFNGDTTIKYKKGMPHQIITRNSSKAKTSIIKISRNPGVKVSVQQFKLNDETNKGVKEIRITETFKNDTLTEKKEIKILDNGETESISTVFKYENNNLTEKVITESGNAKTTSIKYDYYPDGYLKNEIIYHNDKKIRHFFFQKEQTVMHYTGYNCVLQKYRD